MSSTAPALELRGISKSFGSVHALTDVDFEVRSGEVMALVGDNGAGKSTLIECVAGIHPIDRGEIYSEGKLVHIRGPKDAARLGIEVVYQDLALCDNLDVVQKMYLGREEHDWLQRLKEPVMESRSAETLQSLAVTTIGSIRQPVARLSGAMAAIGGIIFTARLSAVDLNAGGGTILLDAIAAAVIGGTSLFGGRGTVPGALLGAAVIATIANGSDLVGYSSATRHIVTGIILFAAVTLDTVSRRRLAASGR